MQGIYWGNIRDQSGLGLGIGPGLMFRKMPRDLQTMLNIPQTWMAERLPDAGRMNGAFAAVRPVYTAGETGIVVIQSWLKTV